MINTRYETENYVIRIDISVLGVISSNHQAPVYQLVNKQTGLVEAEGVSLPESILYLLNREACLQEALEAFEIGNIPGAFGDEQGEVH